MGSQNKNQEKNNKKVHEGGGSKKIITDSRFASIHSDPRFQDGSKHKAKVAIDSRFDRMFTDKNFGASSSSLDKRGKAKNEKNLKNPLRHYYQIEEEKERREEEGESEETSEDSEEDVDEVETSSDLDSDEDEAEIGESEDVFQGLLGSITDVGKKTSTLEAIEMDWRNVKAVDLYVLFNSFIPKGKQVLSVAIYPTDFGLKRMEEENLHGPVGVFDDEEENSDEDDDDDEIDNVKVRAREIETMRYYHAVVKCDSVETADHLHKNLNGWELERSSNFLQLRFIPDSTELKHPPRDMASEAPSNYESLGFETTALQQSKINLTWDEDEPHRVKALKRKFNDKQLADLELKEFLASDESESDDENDIDLAEDLPDGKKHKIGDKYRALLESGNSSDEEDETGGQDMEITFNTGLEDISNRILEKKGKKNSETVWEAYLRKRQEKKKARKNNRSKHSSSEDESYDNADHEAAELEDDDFFLEEKDEEGSVKRSKKKGRGKQEMVQMDMGKEAEASQAELELLLADEQGGKAVKGYSLKHFKKTKEGKQLINGEKIPTVHYEDPRFSSLFNSPLFALDPTDPNFKWSAAYARQVAMKQQMKGGPGPQEVVLPQKNKEEGDPQVAVKSGSDISSLRQKEKHELSCLVKSIKMKSKLQDQFPSHGNRIEQTGEKRKKKKEA